MDRLVIVRSLSEAPLAFYVDLAQFGAAVNDCLVIGLRVVLRDMSCVAAFGKLQYVRERLLWIEDEVLEVYG